MNQSLLIIMLLFTALSSQANSILRITFSSSNYYHFFLMELNIYPVNNYLLISPILEGNHSITIKRNNQIIQTTTIQTYSQTEVLSFFSISKGFKIVDTENINYPSQNPPVYNSPTDYINYPCIRTGF